MNDKYYHGGPRGLKKILPPSITGAPSCASYGAGKVCRRDKVYLGLTAEHAMIFAAMNPSGPGAVYEVEPVGVAEHDPDWFGEPGESVQADAAIVIRRVPVKTKLLIKLRKELMKGL